MDVRCGSIINNLQSSREKDFNARQLRGQVNPKVTTILTNPSFLLKFSTTRFGHVSAYYQVMFNTDEQFLFYNFMMILKGNKLTRLNKLT